MAETEVDEYCTEEPNRANLALMLLIIYFSPFLISI